MSRSESAGRPPSDFADRAHGAVLGLALGDALGTTVEFRRPGTFEPVTDLVGGGPFGLERGEWTDDTSMALCLAESLVESRGFDATDQLERYVRWWRAGHWSVNGRCFDIGNTVRAALARFERTGDAAAGSDDPQSAGNGSLMRLAPVPIFFADDPRVAVELSGESSRTTHGALAAVDACRWFGGLLVAALRGATKDELLSPRSPGALGLGRGAPLCPEIAEIAAGSFLRREPPEIVGSGYVVRSLEAALWAFARSDDFRSGALLAVNLGDDADTTGAIYGQLAGACYGRCGLPAAWVEALAHLEAIEALTNRLVDAGAALRRP